MREGLTLAQIGRGDQQWIPAVLRADPTACLPHGKDGRGAGATSRASARLRRLGWGNYAVRGDCGRLHLLRVQGGRSGFIVEEADVVRAEEIVVEFDFCEEIDDDVYLEIVEEADFVRVRRALGDRGGRERT